MNFEKIYQTHKKKIFLYVFGKTENKEVAEDLTAETFYRAFKDWEKIKERDEEGIIAWIYTVARNLTVDYYRSKKPVSLEYEPAGEEQNGIMQDIMKDENKEMLHEAVQKLSKDKQDLLELRFGQDLSFAQISKIIGKREPACKMKLYRTLKELQSILT